MLHDFMNVITLAVLGYIDYVNYKIPNVILCGWLVTTMVMLKDLTPIKLSTILVSLLVTGSYIPLRHIVKCNAGDFKLYGVLTVSKGLNDALWIILITQVFSVFPWASGIKKIQMASVTFFGYIAFLLLKIGGCL